MKKRLLARLATIERAIIAMDRALSATRTAGFATEPYPDVEDTLHALRAAYEECAKRVADLRRGARRGGNMSDKSKKAVSFETKKGFLFDFLDVWTLGPNHYVYYAEEASSWFAFDDADIEAAWALKDVEDDEDDWYSDWCAARGREVTDEDELRAIRRETIEDAPYLWETDET